MSESPAPVPGSRLEGNGVPSQAREPAPLPEPVGPLSSAVVTRLHASAGAANGDELLPASPVPVSDALADDDLQLALYLCYELHYTGFAAIDPRWEWDPE